MKTVTKIGELSFEAALEQFQEFLASNGISTDLLWVFEEDTYQRNGNLFEKHFWLKLPLSESNIDFAGKIFEYGKRRGLGMCIGAYASCSGRVCCGIIVPRDEDDAESLQLSAEHIRYSYTINMPAAQAVTSRLRWKTFGLFPRKYRRGNFFTYLQSKKNLQFPPV